MSVSRQYSDVNSNEIEALNKLNSKSERKTNQSVDMSQKPRFLKDCILYS